MREMNKEISADANRALLTLGITSKLSGIPVHSIRQYIEKGLLIPFKLDNKRHLFSMNDVSRLKHIH
jgi:DNA-binding transcriptional MerR regulator